MTELDTALTDYLLCIESFIFAVAVGKIEKAKYRHGIYSILFLSFGLASFTGGTTHGFYSDPSNNQHNILWWLTLFFVGIISYGFASGGLDLILLKQDALRWNKILLLFLFIYCIVIIFQRSFLAAVIIYIPAVTLSLIGFIFAYRRFPSKKIKFGIYGLALSFLATVLQQLKISVYYPIHLTHNAVYHLILMAVLYMFFVGVKNVINIGDIERDIN